MFLIESSACCSVDSADRMGDDRLQDKTKYPPVAEACFNLWDEPWIDVLFCDGTNGLLSLTDVFQRAREIRDVCEELPIQDVSILRLLICIIHSCTNVTMKKWKRWHEDRELPIDQILRYKEEHYDEFYLFHPTHPFMQVADLTFADENKATLGNNGLLYDYPGDTKIMRMRTDESISTVSCAESARLLLTAQNYDVCKPHTPLHGDIVKKGKTYPKLPSLAHNTVIILEGANLLETLLQNTVPLDVPTMSARKNEILSGEEDLPSWDARVKTNDVFGPRSALCRQSRRIRLIPNFLFEPESVGCPGVVGAMIGPGEPVSWDDCFYFEDMSIFRHIADKKSDDEYFKPLRFSRQPYKELHSRIVGQAAYYAGDASESAAHSVKIEGGLSNMGNKDKLSNNMTFASYLLDEGDVDGFDKTRMLSFRTVTVGYGKNESVIKWINDDRTRISPYSLSGPDQIEICNSIFSAIGNTDSIENAYKLFLKNVGKVNAPSSTLDADADELNKMKLALEEAFQSWVEQDLVSDVRDELWKARGFNTVQRVLDEYLTTCVRIRDLIGYCDKEGKEHSVSREEALFRRKMNKTLFGDEGYGKGK